MQNLTRDEVRKVLGPVDDTVVAQIVATGASQDELAEANGWLTADEALINAGHALPSGRIGQLVEMLQAVERDRWEPER